MHDRSATRPMLRLALGIHEQLVAGRPPPEIALPHDAWDELCTIVNRLRLAQDRRWNVAASRLTVDVESIVRALSRRLLALLPTNECPPHNRAIASLGDVFADLRALHDEFSEVRIESKAHQLIVVTDEIHLEHFNLGRFEIVLNWRRLGEARAYDVVALDPAPAASDSSTTHPHVRDDSLCEGDGHAPIHNALRQGRLLDFFILVRQILETYNPDSAYIRLSSWNGATCHDCGSLAAEDETTLCDRCETDLCCDCSSCCTDCARSCCSGCYELCGGC